jgi:hypothetical protein
MRVTETAQETLRFRAWNTEDYAAALHGYQAAVDATESPEGEVGETAVYTLVKGSTAHIILYFGFAVSTQITSFDNIDAICI